MDQADGCHYVTHTINSVAKIFKVIFLGNEVQNQLKLWFGFKKTQFDYFPLHFYDMGTRTVSCCRTGSAGTSC